MAELLQSFPKTSVVPKNIFLVLGATPVLETDADTLRKGAFFQEPGSAVLLLPTQKASPTDNLLTEIQSSQKDPFFYRLLGQCLWIKRSYSTFLLGGSINMAINSITAG